MWQYNSWASPALVKRAVPAPPLTPEPTNKNSELPLKLRSSALTPTTPCTCSRSASSPHARVGCRAALMDHLGHIGNLAAHDPAERRAHAAEKAHRLDAVADYHAARRKPHEPHAVDFVAGQAREFWCVLHGQIVSYCKLAVDADAQAPRALYTKV